MGSTIIDSAFLKDLYGTPEMRAVFSDSNLLQKWLDIEAALAQAEAELGLIPVRVAEEIRRAAHSENISWEAIKQGVDDTVHPIVPVIRALQAACNGDAGEYIHWGATTQDIMDTALVLQIKEALPIIENRLEELSAALVKLTEAHRDTLMPGRTHGQHALPITFGYKTAVWLAEIERHRRRLEQLKPRLLVGQLGGAAGTLASLQSHALPVQERVMAILGLQAPVITWHTSRDCFAEYAGLMAMLSASLGKISHEIITLQRTEVAEVEEPFNAGKVGSSTMPHKRNPMYCEAILALSRLVMRLAPAAWDAMIQENERDWSSDHIEWAYMPEINIYTDGALALAVRVTSGLQVHPENMRRNLELTDGLIMSEAVMLALAKHIGRQSAHDAVYRCAMKSHQDKQPFADVLARDPVVAPHLVPAQIKDLLDPKDYNGIMAISIDRLLIQAATHKKADTA